MYGIVSVAFIAVTAFIYYQASTYSQIPFQVNQIQMDKLVKAQNYELFGTCIDKTVVSKKPLQQLKIKSQSVNTFAVTFDRNPWLKCSQLVQAFQVTNTESNQFSLSLEQGISQLKTIVKQYQVKSLQKDEFLKIRDHQSFVLVVSIVDTKESSIKDLKISKTSILAIQNLNYSESILSPLLLFGIFNLIAISLIAYYKKNVFNTRVKLLSTVTLLVYLMWIGFQTPISLEEAQSKIKLAMTCFLLILCIKNHLNTCQTFIIVGFSVLNQLLLTYVDHQNNDKWSLLIWLFYGLNFINASFVAKGQNVEVVYFSIYGFVTQYGFVNQALDIMHPIFISLILVTLLFGPTIFELLDLKENFDIQARKTKERLHSYELSENDNLFAS